jgi:hypothetical protein
MRAVRKVISQTDFTKSIPLPPPTKFEKWLGLTAVTKEMGPDKDAYYKAILDFVSEQGPTQVINVQAFNTGHYDAFTYIWYWEVET